MLLIKPAYFSRFRCIAADCPDSCCKEWSVEVDPESAAMYRALPGALGARLRQVLSEEDGVTVMAIENGRCPMWRPDGLCRIQAELGEAALCKTCRDFPRLTHDYGDFIEMGLELSCPEAARLILTTPPSDPITEEIPGGTPPEYDPQDMEILLKTRAFALKLLYDPKFSVTQALILLLYYGYHAQELLDGGEDMPFQPEPLLQEAKSMAIPGGEEALAGFFQSLEVLAPSWQDRLSKPLVFGPWAAEIRNLARYFIERYWLQAISDYDLICRVKFSVVSCIFVHSLGGDVVQTAQAYSKEIENSPENMDAVLDAAYTHPALTDQRILGMLQ